MHSPFQILSFINDSFLQFAKDLKPYTSKWVIKARCENMSSSSKLSTSFIQNIYKFNLFIVTDIMGVVVDTGNVVTQGNSKLLELQIMDK
ncbi:hypothetical protein SASPL_127013 [Salvia splendens]|uniref:Uncharacterized protein n=1 Tax=Salvia splendens TaxID=180675 RepID=A0A8X8XKK4_SALSN|nr:hypothetical protein SASPL_127013 [Salvia splendens]